MLGEDQRKYTYIFWLYSSKEIKGGFVLSNNQECNKLEETDMSSLEDNQRIWNEVVCIWKRDEVT